PVTSHCSLDSASTVVYPARRGTGADDGLRGQQPMQARTVILLLALPLTIQSAAQPVTASRLDAWGDPLPPGALFRTGTLRDQHSVTGALCFSPDGKMLAGIGHDDTIRLWDAASGRDIRTFRGHPGGVHCFDFTADGKTLVSGGEDG